MPQPRLRRAVSPQPAWPDFSSFPVLSPAARSIPAARRSPRLRTFVWVAVVAILQIGGCIAHADSIVSKPQNVGATEDPFAASVAEASQRFGIPASWIRAVMRVESLGYVRALSPKGAMGLMQIMPAAWAALRSRYHFGADPYNAHDNILAGAAYLRELHDRYDAPGFLAAYNAGPARYEEHLATGRPLPAETQAYVAVLAPVIGGRSVEGTMIVEAVVRSWTDAPLFVVRAESSATKSPVSSDPRPSQRSTDKGAHDWTGLAPQSQGLFVSTSRRNPQP